MKIENLAKFWTRGHLKVPNFFSKASSSSSSLWSITSLYLDIVRKHLEGILSRYLKFYEFPEKNSDFLKKLRLFHFRLIFLLDSFLVSPKDPRITKNYWLSRKGQPRSALIFFRNGIIIFRISRKVLKTMNLSWV